MTKVSGWAVVGLSTDVASPATTVIEPGNKGIHVGSALFAAYDSGRTRRDCWNFVFAMGKRTKNPTQNNLTGRG
jgi:hypothetical protein